MLKIAIRPRSITRQYSADEMQTTRKRRSASCAMNDVALIMRYFSITIRECAQLFCNNSQCACATDENVGFMIRPQLLTAKKAARADTLKAWANYYPVGGVYAESISEQKTALC